MVKSIIKQITLSILFSGLLYTAPANVTFTQQPTVSANGSGINISFGVSASTDAEVAILDANGKIVRHLAAGVLGGQYAPPAPLAAGLSQSLNWDGNDDYGNAAVGGPFSVRVRLGLRPDFERSLNTKVYTSSGSWEYGPGGVNPTNDFLYPGHPLLSGIGSSTGPMYALTPRLDIAVSDRTEEVFLRVDKHRDSYLARYNGTTGNLLGFITSFTSASGASHLHFGEPYLDWDGNYFYHTEGDPEGSFHRFTLTGQPAPWPNTGTFSMSGFSNTDWHSQGIAGAPDGSIYLMHYSSLHTPPQGVTGPMVTSHIKDGVAIEREMIVIHASVSGGIKVDLQGNIYIAARVKPKGRPIPPYLEGKLSGSYDAPRYTTQAWWGEEMYGSILKFGPSGGSVVLASGGNLIAGAGRSETSGERFPATATGLIWMYYGYSHVLEHVSFRQKCWCNMTRFDIDRYGRLFFPNTFEYEFISIDNNRNEIFRFKNRDIPEVAIGLGHQLEVTDRALYIADHYNNQVVSFLLNAEQEATVSLPTTLKEGDLLHSNALSLTNFPNPFRQRTAITVRLSSSNTRQGRNKVNLRIFDINGKVVKDFSSSIYLLPSTLYIPKMQSLVWEAATQPPGIYFARFQLGQKNFERKLLLIK